MADLRIGLAALYVPYYEPLWPAMRQEKEALAAEAAHILAAWGAVTSAGLVADLEAARRAGAALAAARPDVVVLLPAVAAFGELAAALLQPLRAPVLIWHPQEVSAVPPDYNMSQLVRHSGALGVQATGNTLARQGRHFKVVTGTLHDTVRLGEALRALGAAGRLSRARLGRFGSPMPEMTDIVLDGQRLHEALGAEVAEVSVAEIHAAYFAVPDGAVRDEAAAIRSRFQVQNLSDDEMARSVRLALAVEGLAAQHRLDAGSLNCHSAICLRSDTVGLTGCLGVSRLCSAGRPFSCTGDLPTAIAMLIARWLAGSALYGETDLLDLERDAVLVTNEGVGDLSLVCGPVVVRGNENFRGPAGGGASFDFALRPGPATLVSFTPVRQGYRLVTAEGELLPESKAPHLAAPSGLFRFRSGGVVQAFERWCEAGAVHHCAVAGAHIGGAVSLLAAALGLEHLDV